MDGDSCGPMPGCNATKLRRLTRGITLLPGDVIATGTPGGVGDSRDPRRYLRAGETVTVTVGGVGTLANPVTFEQ